MPAQIIPADQGSDSRALRQGRDQRRRDSGVSSRLDKFFREEYLPASRDHDRHLGYAGRRSFLPGPRSQFHTTTKLDAR